MGKSKYSSRDPIKEIKPRSLPITNYKVLEILRRHHPWEGKILDLGAGSGYFCSLVSHEMEKRNLDPSKHLFASDVDPSSFQLKTIKCYKLDFNKPLPFESETFDAVLSIEVIEHLENIYLFLKEMFRILKPKGVAIITTPNILNIVSRLKYLTTGFPMLFGPLPISSEDRSGLEGHINPVSYYYLVYFLKKVGFSNIKLHTDRLKNTAIFLLPIFYFMIKLVSAVSVINLKKYNRTLYKENSKFLKTMNSLQILLGRTVILEAKKTAQGCEKSALCS